MAELRELLERGSWAQLENGATAVLGSEPDNGVLWQLLAIAQQRQGRDALPSLQHAARCLPNDAVAQLNLANSLARAGRLPEAGACYQKALTLRPDFAEAHANLGEMLLEQEMLELAAGSCARALALQPDLAPARQTMAKICLSQERFADAAEHGRRAIGIDPNFAEAHNTLGNVLVKLIRVEESLRCFRTAVALKPDFVEAHMNLAAAQRSLGHLDLAAAGYRRVLEIAPEIATAHVGLATVLRLQRRSAESQNSCDRALQIDPKSTAALAVLAELCADAGQFARAEELHRRIIAMDESALDSWAAVAKLRRMTAADAEWLAGAERFMAAPLSARRELPLRYAMGKYFDDVGNFGAAFQHYRRANELSVQCAPRHDRALLTRTVDLIIRSQDRSWAGGKQAAGDSSDRPVFIVGMLRSGTTLAEQILASHPAVFGAGELTFFGAETVAVYTAAAAEGAVLDFSRAELHRLATGYLELLRRLSPDSARVVDKFPPNFFFLGLIRAALPQARIIHMQRDPRDTCLSIFFQQFEAVNTYANDLEDLAHYYLEYRRLMRHWSNTLPGDALLHVPYERLVAEPEEWSRRMVDFIGLPWDARCLSFHRTERPVVTASRWQVRQGINKSSLGRWRNYQRFLGPLAALRPES
jgi:tetratricopeptide (TPR) repeat protein